MDWITETEAAKMIGKSRRILRKHAKSGHWPLDYTAPNGRGYLYSKESIEKMLDIYSSKNVTKCQEPKI